MLAILAAGAPAGAADKPPPSRGSAPLETGSVNTDRLVGTQLARRTRLARVSAWGIQLRHIDADAIAKSDLDLVVIDYAPYRHLTFEFPFSPGDIARMQTKPDGSKRLVLAYLSIGEAEDYRYYWHQDWYAAATAPSWLGRENPAWPGNFPVRFWDAGWQQTLFAGPGSYLSRIQAAGFDGIYLDRTDVYQEWAHEKPDSERAMASMLADLAAHARAQRPDFLVMLQNAEELLKDPAITRIIDGFAKEDLYLGATKDGEPNAPEMVSASLSLIKRAQKSGIATFVLEYPQTPTHASIVRKQAARDGFLLHVAERSLEQLTLAPDATTAPPVPN